MGTVIRNLHSLLSIVPYFPRIPMPHITLIAALGIRTRAIGKDGGLLWHLPPDLQRFKSLTMGHPIIMGSVTFASIGKLLPGRTTIVISNNPSWKHEGVVATHTIADAFAQAALIERDEIFVVGGGSVYAQTITYADRLMLTLVEDDSPGDTFFPDWSALPFKETAREAGPPGPIHYTWVTYERPDVVYCPHGKT